MYTFETRVRYSECNTKEQAGLTSILDYLQDVCTFQAEDLGIGVRYMEQHQIVWLLNSWQVDIQRYPMLGENIKISTWPYDFYGFYGFRNFKVEDEAGEIIVRANSVWIFMDLQKGRPAKITPELQAIYQKEEQLDMEYLDRKIPDFEPETVGKEIKIPHYFIDTNHHVNNAKYILLAEELLSQNFEVARIRAEYRSSAVYGDILRSCIKQQPGKMSVKLEDQSGKTYAVMEFFDKSKIGYYSQERSQI